MRISKKICLLGDESVGKSSISTRFADDEFSDKYKATIGVKLFQKVVDLNEKQVNLIVWDIQGGKELISSPQQYYRGAHGLIFVCDISNNESIQNISYYYDIVKKKYPTAKKILLLNKCDLSEFSLTAKEAMLTYKDMFDNIINTSAKTGLGVNEAFKLLASDFID